MMTEDFILKTEFHLRIILKLQYKFLCYFNDFFSFPSVLDCHKIIVTLDPKRKWTIIFQGGDYPLVRTEKSCVKYFLSVLSSLSLLMLWHMLVWGGQGRTGPSPHLTVHSGHSCFSVLGAGIAGVTPGLYTPVKKLFLNCKTGL